ncbi:MAG: GyrI-like domain-containing protein [Nitrolancea sp.]
MVGEIQVRELPEQLVFSWRGKVRVSEIPAKMGEVYGKIFPYLMRQGVGFAGPPFAIYYEMPQGDAPMDMEVGVPVTKEVPATEDMSTHPLPGGTVAATVYQGPYDEIGPAYDEVMNWVASHGYEPSGAPREAYLNSPDEVKSPAEYLTEVVFPVKKKAA